MKHLKQRGDILRTKLEEWYPRGAKSENIVTKYRKGACENCGASTHILKGNEWYQNFKTIIMNRF